MATLSKLDKLNYSIGIIDKVTGPVNKVMAKINQLSQQTAAAQDQMMRGAATAVGGAYALAKSLAPAIDQVAALGEVQSVGALGGALDELNNKGLQFISEFGGKAPDFVRSAYKIQQAVKPIGGELAEITRLSNLTAVALRTDANTVSDTFGKIYNSNKQYADKIGKVNFFDELAGKMAHMQGAFSMEGGDLNSALGKLGSKATAKGVDLNEQLAVIGVLKDYAKSGSAAAGIYGGFIDKIGNAGKALNIDFYENGKLIETDKIIEKINDKLEGATKSQRENILDKVLGASGRGLVDHLTTQIGRVTNETEKLKQIKDHGEAEKLANIIASPWDRLGGSFNAAATAMGQRLLPVVEPFVEVLASMFAGIVSLTEEFPFLSSVIATAVVGVVALMTAFGIATFAMGLYNFATGLGITLANAQIIVNKLWLASLWALRVLGFLSLIATVSAAAIAFGVFKTAMLVGQAAVWLFNAALWANPLTWIVIAAVALIAAVAALIYYFDDITAAFNDWAQGSMIFKYLKVAFDLITLPLQLVWWLIKTIAAGIVDFFAPAFSAISSVVMGMVNAIGSAFSYVGNLLSSFGGAITGFFSGMGSSVSGFFTGIWQSAVDIIESLINYLTEKFGILGDFFGGIASGISGIFDGVSSFISAIAENGVLNSVISFFSDEEPVKTKVEQVAQLQGSGAAIQMHRAANDPVYSAQPKVMTEREAANDAFKFTSQRLPAVPTDNTAPLNLQSQARSQALINSAFPTANNVEQLKAEQSEAAYKPKVQKSAYLQNLTNNSNSTNNNSKSDHSKRVYIDNLTVKSDDPINSIEQMMELAG